MLDENLKHSKQSNESSLRSVIKRAWKKIDQNHIKNAIDSMNKRLCLVKEAGGGHFK